MKTLEVTEMESQLKELGFSLEVLSGPNGHVNKDWPCIQFTVRLMFQGKRVLDTDYSMGVGHVNPKTATVRIYDPAGRFTREEEALLDTWRRKPYANFSNKDTWANVAAKLAKKEKLTPTLPEVLHSLLMDGSPHFNHQSFEDWASEYGYGEDSREAERIYRLCDDIGRKLAHAMPQKTLEAAQRITQDI